MRALVLAVLFAASVFAQTTKKDEGAVHGGVLFVRACAGCHGNDGKALMDAGGDATDLTAPQLYRHGSTDADILRSIRRGANGMPAFESDLKEAEIQDLLKFIHSLWPK